ncbi:hypothetical protein [Actinomadura rupiterrae]|nr:hypothetical protein [Actinomadura rupiterrae]MCP2337447.1 hypothetical protein [Actinomadura rupiterrae]
MVSRRVRQRGRVREQGPPWFPFVGIDHGGVREGGGGPDAPR